MKVLPTFLSLICLWAFMYVNTSKMNSHLVSSPQINLVVMLNQSWKMKVMSMDTQKKREKDWEGRGAVRHADLGNHGTELNMNILGKLYLTGLLASFSGSSSITLTF